MHAPDINRLVFLFRAPPKPYILKPLFWFTSFLSQTFRIGCKNILTYMKTDTLPQPPDLLLMHLQKNNNILQLGNVFS